MGKSIRSQSSKQRSTYTRKNGLCEIACPAGRIVSIRCPDPAEGAFTSRLQVSDDPVGGGDNKPQFVTSARSNGTLTGRKEYGRYSREGSVTAVTEVTPPGGRCRGHNRQACAGKINDAAITAGRATPHHEAV
jgi:hypothetical protein